MSHSIPLPSLSSIVAIEKTGKLKNTCWNDNKRAGRKPSLDRKTLIGLIDDYKVRTDGGKAMSKTALSNKINYLIKKEWEEMYGEKYKGQVVPEATLRKYVDSVYGLEKFNTYSTVSNKTESRMAAEFSIRSTLSYMMVVLSTHYINAEPSRYHVPQSILDEDPIYKIIKQCNQEALGVNEFNDIPYHLTHVLNHLVTSTDECTLFISSEIINNKEVWYFTSRPSVDNKPFISSSKRDVFTDKLSGDKHHRGLHITLNNTFTAGGAYAPVFACIYGLSAEEIPRDEIVVKKVEGLVASSGQNVSTQEGFVVYIRGKYETKEEIEEKEKEINDTKDQPVMELDAPKKMSKEARVAKLYRELVYYPLVQHSRRGTKNSIEQIR